MSLQTITIVVDVPADQDTGVESAAAAAVAGLQDAGVIVTAAACGGVSLLPSPAELLRAAVDNLATLSKTRPSAADLAAAVTKVDDAAKVVEAAGAAATATAVSTDNGVALPDEPPAASHPTPVNDPPAPAVAGTPVAPAEGSNPQPEPGTSD